MPPRGENPSLTSTSTHVAINTRGDAGDEIQLTDAIQKLTDTGKKVENARG